MKWIKCDVFTAINILDNRGIIKVYYDVGDYYLNVLGFDIGDVGFKSKIYDDYFEFIKDLEDGKFQNSNYYRNGE